MPRTVPAVVAVPALLDPHKYFPSMPARRAMLRERRWARGVLELGLARADHVSISEVSPVRGSSGLAPDASTASSHEQASWPSEAHRDDTAAEELHQGTTDTQAWSQGSAAETTSASTTNSVSDAGLVASARSRSRATTKASSKAKAAGARAPKATAKAKSVAGGRPEPMWGRCLQCGRAMQLKVRHADGRPFLSCAAYPRCWYARSFPEEWNHRLPVAYVRRVPLL